ADDEGVFTFTRDKEMDLARLFGGGDHGEADWRTRRIEIQQKNEGKAIGELGSVVDVILNCLAILVARCDLLVDGIDEHVERLWEGRATLDVMITDELKNLALG